MLENGISIQLQKSNQIFSDLSKLAEVDLNLKALFAKDNKRAEKFSLEACDLFLDFSKNLIDPAIFSDLIRLAETAQIEPLIEALFRGKHLNTTENKPALHMLLRETALQGMQENPLMAAVLQEREQLFKFTQQFQAGECLGVAGKALKTVVNIGIGGSDLGPRMASYALIPYYQAGLSVHFISNGDPTELKVLLDTLDPNEVLFIVSSKSFRTEETLMNAQAAFKWLASHVGKQNIGSQFVAVTAHPECVSVSDFEWRAVFNIWDWVGGRFSVWSSIGLPLALMVGKDNFLSFLHGASEMDHHFRYAPLSKNMPVILALLGVWYVNFKKIHQHAVIPYHQLLFHFPSFLQQLEMESNGKSVSIEGKPVEWATCPILWGGVGSNSQHAFHQFLHQGTNQGPIDFIVAAQNSYHQSDQQLYLIAQCISQAEVLMQGYDGPAHQRLVGNRPSNMIVLPKLTPKILGSLIALYEHKVFIQSRLWQINAFDQPGVERGKTIAKLNFSRLKSKINLGELDASTAQLLDKIKKWM